MHVLLLELLPEALSRFQKLIDEVERTVVKSSSKMAPREYLSGGRGKLERNSAVNKALLKTLRNIEDNKGMKRRRKLLPVYEMKDAILDAIHKNAVVIVSGEGGAGKTCQVPQYILDNYIERGEGSLCNVLCVQPRKISAVASAKQTAKERGEDVGSNSSIGCFVRTEKKCPREPGSILFTTSETVRDLLFADRQLSRYSHVVVSQIQERDPYTDFIICVLKELIRERNDLRLILMGSQVEALEFRKYFDNCEIVEIAAFTHPVKRYMLEDILEITKFEPTRTLQQSDAVPSNFLAKLKRGYSPETIKKLSEWNESFNPILVRVVLGYVCKKPENGSIMVMLPSREYVNKMHDRLINDRMFGKEKYLVVPVDEEIPLSLQKRLVDRPRKGVQKIILSSNITESSVTIEDVGCIIDCGKNGEWVKDRFHYTEALKLEWISKSAVRRRTSRAGIAHPGKSYHLYTSYRESLMSPCQYPQIENICLDHLCMTIKLLHLGGIAEFFSKLMTPPLKESVKYSVSFLEAVGCFDPQDNLTQLGSVLSQLPLNPCLGKMVLFGALFSCLSPAVTIAAMLDHVEPFSIEPRDESYTSIVKKLSKNSQSDHIMLANAFKGWLKSTSKEEFCEKYCLSFAALRKVDRLRHEYTHILHCLGFVSSGDPEHELSNINLGNQELVKAIICAGLSSNICVVGTECSKKNYYSKYTMLSTHMRSVLNDSPNFQEKWAVFYKKIHKEIYDVTLLRPMTLFLFGLRGKESRRENELIIDNWIRVTSPGIPLELLLDIRRVFTNLVDEMIRDRKPTDWQNRDAKTQFLNCIIKSLKAKRNVACCD